MQSAQDSYSPSECVRLLEEAQCGDSDAASRALRTVAQRCDAPHASVTAAALDLLVVHPAATIPHLPDLISASPSDVALAVTAFGDLLPTDRGLLVPILAAFAEMPLTRAHEDAARATLRYALTTVDGDDVPVVARALLRCASAPALARWAVATLRAALRRELTPHVGALLAIVVAEKARAYGPVGKALRAAAGEGGISGVDIVTWIVCLQRARAAFDALGTEVADSVRACVRSGALLAGEVDRLEREVSMAGQIAAEMPQGVVALVQCVVDAFSSDVRQAEIVAAVVLVRRLLRWCPNATNFVLGDLARAVAAGSHVGKVAEAILLGLVSAVLVAPGVRVTFISPHPVPSVAVALAMHSELVNASVRGPGDLDSSRCSAWNEVFLRMRKGLIFGALSDKIVACRLAYAASCKGSVSTLKQMVSLVHCSIPSELTDSLASSFLLVLSKAVLRGAVDADMAAAVFIQRIENQVPKGLFSIRDEISEISNPSQGRNEERCGVRSEEAKNGKSDSSSCMSISVDIAAIKDKTASAVSAVVGTGLALICHQQYEVSPVKPVSSLVVNATVLVPVVCLPLYEAAQIITTDTETTDEQNEKDKYSNGEDGNFKPASPDHIQKVQAMGDAQFQEALAGCMTSIAALIAVVNVACTSLSGSWRVLQIRHEGSSRFIEGVFQDHMWALLERVSELLVMVHAVSFGLDGSTAASQVVKCEISDSEGEDVKEIREQAARQISDDLKTRLTKTLSANMHRQENVSPSTGEPPANDNFPYPVLTLSTVISALVAVPDEKGLENMEKNQASIADRDAELGRIEEFLLRRLVCIIHGPVFVSPAVEAVSAKSENAKEKQSGLAFGHGTLPPPDIEEVAAIEEALDDMNADLDELFYGDPSDSDEEEDEEKPRKKRRRRKELAAGLQWASPLPLHHNDLCLQGLFEGCIADEAISKFGDEAEAAQVLYSPEFSALLLDRAATNTVTASQKRRTLRSAGKIDTLKALNCAVGFALRVFAHVLQNIPVLVKMSYGSILQRLNPAQSVSDFVTATGRRMIAHVSPSVLSTLIVEDTDSTEVHAQRRVVELLEWINKTSIDVASSVLALDCLTLLAEHSVVHSGLVRELMLESSSIVHEYDESTLWTSSDFKLLFSDCPQDWITRRRRAGCGPVCEDELTSAGPWLTVDPHSTNNSFLAWYRLRTIFNGLCTEDAAREACAWAERLSHGLAEEADAEREKSKKLGTLPPFDAQLTLEFLLRVAQSGLQQVRAGHDFALSAAAVAHTLYFVRALRGLVGALGRLKFDHRFAHALSALLGHSRQAVDTLVAQYSAPSTNVPELDPGVVHDLQQLAVALAHGAGEAAKLAAQLKTRSVANAMDARMRTAVLRARHSIPRLQMQAEAARRSATALAKAAGKAAQLDDVATGDGVCAWRARIGTAELVEASADVEAEEDEEADDLVLEAFHSTGGGQATGNTVVVSFRNAR